MKGFKVTYEVYGPRFDANGPHDTGFIDEIGYSCDPDKYDLDEGITAVDKAIRYLRDEGAFEPSASYPHDKIWWTNSNYDTDLFSGEIESRSYHPFGFGLDEIVAIYEGVKK